MFLKECSSLDQKQETGIVLIKFCSLKGSHFFYCRQMYILLFFPRVLQVWWMLVPFIKEKNLSVLLPGQKWKMKSHFTHFYNTFINERRKSLLLINICFFPRNAGSGGGPPVFGLDLSQSVRGQEMSQSQS